MDIAHKWIYRIICGITVAQGGDTQGKKAQRAPWESNIEKNI